MEKPTITDNNLNACQKSIWIGLACIPGGALAYVACEVLALAEIVGMGGAQKA